jgi:cation:H+ antiporter
MSDVLLIAVGLVGLYLGGGWLVQGSTRIATAFGVSVLIIGLTIVAIGTSMPELIVSVLSALRGASGIALGNVIGSNIANIGLILGLTGIIAPIAVHETLIKREIPILLIVTLFASLLILDGFISRLDGVLLLFGFVVYNLLLYFLARQQAIAHDAEIEAKEAAIGKDIPDPGDSVNVPFEVGRVVLGIVVLVIGANLLVDGASNIALALGIPPLVIGVTMVAFGTSVPELATSLTAAFKGESDIAVGNVIGSNVANLLLVLGATAFVLPIEIGTSTDGVGSAELSIVEFGVMIAFTLLLLPFARNREFSRFESALFFGVYLAFVAYTLLSGMAS